MHMEKETFVLELPKLQYAYDALEPYIDGMTMEIHHTKHHAAYLAKYLEAGVDVNTPILEVLAKDDRPVVQNNGGGFVNHALFWKMLSPTGGGKPHAELLKAIEKKYGTFEEFQKQFTDAALGQFGSGWAWLVLKNDHIEIIKKPNQNYPYQDGCFPLLGLDVWEHAYYLKYQNRRPEYVKAFWNVVNWSFVAERFQKN